jgi:uncharacterized hydrophobic protein (TIGR00271 family)
MYSRSDRRRAIKEVIDGTAHTQSYYIRLIAAILIAVCAIFTDSIPTLIASMIVAPLAQPILAMGLGVAALNAKLLAKSAGMLVISCLITLGLASIITTVFDGENIVDKFISFNGNREIATVVAVIAGAIAAYGIIQPKIAATITGVAIAVSLIPPLAASGIGFASNRIDFGVDAAILFGLNVVGIILGSMLMFTAYRLGKEYRKQQK